MAKEIVFHDDPAFARPSTDQSDGDMGMSKREYFAAAAMQGLCANSDWAYRQSEELAACAVQIADAVIDRLNETLKS